MQYVEVSKMNKTVITISREFGSGGRSIGKAVAETLNIPYYDKELIKRVVEETGFSPEYVENVGEYAPEKSIFAYLPSLSGHNRVMNGMSAADFLWLIQSKVIRDLAEKEPCVIVGRCADYILKDNPDAFHVFIHAPIPFRVERIVRLYGESEKEPEKRLSDKDGKRSIHYKHYTGREWGRCQNYHLSLDSSKIGLERCVSIIVDFVGTEREHE